MRLLRGPWNLDFIAEMTSIPHGRHDDQADAAAYAFEEAARQPREVSPHSFYSPR